MTSQLNHLTNIRGIPIILLLVTGCQICSIDGKTLTFDEQKCKQAAIEKGNYNFIEPQPLPCHTNHDNYWQHIYKPERIQTIQPCVTTAGTIYAIRKEADGDLHILLNTTTLSLTDTSLLNQANIEKQHGMLVLEPICVNEPTQESALGICQGFNNTVTIPKVGDRVTVTGDWVLDKEHDWMELHPVYEIKVTP